MQFYKKSEAGLIAVLIIVIVLIFLGWIFNLSQRECRSNKDCGSESYCGSDFVCHPYPTIEKTIVKYNLIVPSLIIGIAIIITAIIFNWEKIKAREKITEHKTKEEYAPKEAEEEIVEPYYKSTSIIKNH